MSPSDTPTGTPDEAELTAAERRELDAVRAGYRSKRVRRSRRLSRLSRVFGALGIMVVAALFFAWVFGAIEVSSTTFAALATTAGLAIVLAVLFSALGYATVRPYLEDGRLEDRRASRPDRREREPETAPGEDDLDDAFE